MRLTFIFLAVLAASVIATSLAAWGITYGVSSARVTMMASEFTQLGLSLLQLFDSFVTGLLKSNSNLVNNILTLERQSGDARMQQTKAQVLHIIGGLVNYTTNATGQSQQQMNQAVDTFAALMGTVFTDFQGVTRTCAADLRSQLAAKVSTFFVNFVAGRTNVLMRFQSLQNLRLVNLRRAATDPITADDCLLLGLVCDSALEFGVYGNVYLVTPGGRFFFCVPAQSGYISQVVINGSQYTEYRQTWLPTSGYKYMDQCMATPPVSVVVGQGCALPQGCQCGLDERCSPWYAPYRNPSVGQRLMASEVFIGKYNLPQVTISYPILNASAASQPFLAAAGTDFVFIGAQNVLQSLPMPAGLFLASILNDTALSQMSAIARKCAANETAPGDPGLPLWSSLRSCDPNLREVAVWLSQNRAAIQAPATVKLSGVVWDIFPDAVNVQLSMQYFTLVGAKDEDTYRAIDASAANASMQLATVRAQQLGRVAANGAATQAYMAAVQAENIQQVQAMQDSFLAQMSDLENRSRRDLEASQQSSTAEVARLMDSQAQEVDSLKSKHLTAVAAATGWILAIVCSILLLVLLCGAWGTVSVTRSLARIIGLMEDVAEMKVENLAVSERSQVTEVARIEAAFQVLVIRLADYKSYMPAGLFQTGDVAALDAADRSVPFAPLTGRTGSAEDSGSERTGTSSTVRRTISTATIPGALPRQQSDAPRHTYCVDKPNESTVPGSPSRRHCRRKVAVVVVNLSRFREVLPTLSDHAVRNAFSQYISVIHEAVSRDHGHVDCVLGDQAFATFNAHLPCADPAGPAATAALGIRSRLLPQAKDGMNFQVGVAFGLAHAVVAGYAKFKSMVTLGTPMKIASMLSHVPHFENGSVIADTATEERLRYGFSLRPAEVVSYPGMPAGTQTGSRIFLLQAKRNMHEDEWMYQLDSSPESDWSKLFGRVEAAPTLADMQGALSEYLAVHPKDSLALRLESRLQMWIPGAGISL